MLHPVGFGGSAVKIHVLQEFFARILIDLGLAHVAVLPLIPSYESELPAITQAQRTMPVVQVTQSIRVEPDCVSIIPPEQYQNHHESLNRFVL
ncbi:MAG: hypothetical protein EOO38_15650 [Cytophagaceae bacterium]|nr:MAG: hypothetical protein EOO38_15650 [Cytophagaceae bacterium]